MTISVDDIRAWAAERFAEVREEGSVAIFGLLHYPANGVEVALHAMSSKLATEKWNADSVATTMDAIASRHARGLNGVQQFQLIATFGTSAKPAAFLPFQRVGGLTHGPLPGGGLATEAATPQGGLAQGMRLTELLVQGSFAQNAHNASTMQSLLQNVMQRLDTTEKRSDERWLALQNLLSQWQQQALGNQLRALGIEAGRKLMPLLPAAVSTITGSDRLVSQAAVEESLFDTLVENYDGPQLQEILQAMPQGEAGGALSAIIADQLFRAKRRKEARDLERREGPTRSYEEGELDAAGMALRALKGESSPPAQEGAGTKIVAALEQANGHGSNGAKAATPSHANGDATLIEDMLGGENEENVRMMAAMLDAKKPGLGARVLARFEAANGGHK